MTRHEALARMTGPGEPYELIEREVLRRRYRVFRNAPGSLRDQFAGEVARIDADGYVIVDRIKHLIIRAGENIACARVEAALLEHPEILEAGVFAVPGARLSEAVGAAMFPPAAFCVDELRTFLEGRLAIFEMPEHLWVHAGPLPSTASGELFKHGVRDAVVKGDPADRRVSDA